MENEYQIPDFMKNNRNNKVVNAHIDAYHEDEQAKDEQANGKWRELGVSARNMLRHNKVMATVAGFGLVASAAFGIKMHDDHLNRGEATCPGTSISATEVELKEGAILRSSAERIDDKDGRSNREHVVQGDMVVTSDQPLCIKMDENGKWIGFNSKIFNDMTGMKPDRLAWVNEQKATVKDQDNKIVHK